MFYLLWIYYLQKLLLINICQLLQEAVMTSILRECPNPRKHFLMTPYFEISWPVKCFIMTPPQWLVYTASSYTAACFTSFMLCLTTPQIYTRVTDTRKYLILKPSSVNTNHLQSNPNGVVRQDTWSIYRNKEFKIKIVWSVVSWAFQFRRSIRKLSTLLLNPIQQIIQRH